MSQEGNYWLTVSQVSLNQSSQPVGFVRSPHNCSFLPSQNSQFWHLNRGVTTEPVRVKSWNAKKKTYKKHVVQCKRKRKHLHNKKGQTDISWRRVRWGDVMSSHKTMNGCATKHTITGLESYVLSCLGGMCLERPLFLIVRDFHHFKTHEETRRPAELDLPSFFHKLKDAVKISWPQNLTGKREKKGVIKSGKWKSFFLIVTYFWNWHLRICEFPSVPRSVKGLKNLWQEVLQIRWL